MKTRVYEMSISESEDEKDIPRDYKNKGFRRKAQINRVWGNDLWWGSRVGYNALI